MAQETAHPSRRWGGPVKAWALSRVQPVGQRRSAPLAPNGTLAQNDFVAVTGDAPRGVAGVDDQLGGIDDGAEVVTGMVGRDDDGVVTGERLRVEGHGLHLFE